jgi:aldose 1-epimerase
MSVAPSGEQFEIRWRDQRAVIVEVGGGVREFTAGERPVLDPYPVGAMADGGHGIQLIPWPNRLADGRYRFDGTDYQVALTEPSKHNAIHGFLRWRSWHPAEQTDDRVVMAIRLYPLQGYPFTLDVEISYQLSDAGLTVTTTVTNAGERACPYGSGAHPYLSPGSGPIDEATLQFEAGRRILTDDRQLPAGTEPVAGSAFDFRNGRRLGDLSIDHAFTDLGRDNQGRSWVHLTGSDGRRSDFWLDEHYPYVQLYTGDTLGPDRRRQGLGTEPMTCPPNAFQTGEGVIRLEPGQTASSSWGARLAPAG